MTSTKKLKKAIRARSAQTGESYTAARRQILLARGAGPLNPTSRDGANARASAQPVKPAPKPGISDASVVKATGHGYDHWFGVLDAFDATAKGHTTAAAHLRKDHGVRGWHAQMITVEYERARGRRIPNQSCTGEFQVGVSRAVAATVAEVAEALSGGRWLNGVDPELSRAFPKPANVVVKDAKNAKLRFKWGAGTVEIRITAKKGGSTVVADNMKLADAAQVERRRSQWRGALEALRGYLAK